MNLFHRCKKNFSSSLYETTKRPSMAKAILRKNKAGSISLPEMSCIIQYSNPSMRRWPRIRQMINGAKQRLRIYTLAQMANLLDREGKNTQCGKDNLLNKWYRKDWIFVFFWWGVKVHTWRLLLTQGSPLAGLRGPSVVKRIKPWSGTCKAITLPYLLYKHLLNNIQK